MKSVFPFLPWIGVAVSLCCAEGCGKPGYIKFAEDMCKKLGAADQNHDAIKWGIEQIRSQQDASPNRPITNSISSLPEWVKEVYSDSASGTVITAPTPQNDQVIVAWFSGRGVWGFIIGNSNCAPALPEDLFYFCRCKPGVYTFHSRSDY